MMEAFDYVIVGGGSAGSVLAERLSADGRYSICVLEAGPPDRNPYIQVPAGFIKTLFDPKLTWQFQTEASAHTANRRIQITQGKTLGGSSAVNGGIYNRGQRADFDLWAKRGNAGWSYAEVLPYFRRTEHYWGNADDRFRGRDGALHIGTPAWPDELCDAFVETAVANGLPRNPDYNGVAQEGVGRYQAAIHAGRRVSAAKAFLHPASRRQNVEIRTHALVACIVIKDHRVIGVEYRSSANALHRISARRAVVLSAGAINTPKVLQLSGIGPPELLRERGIQVVHPLPGVGENLRDHFSPRLVFRTKGVDSLNRHVRGLALGREIWRWLRAEPNVLALAPAVCFGFGRSDLAVDRPDFSLVFMPASYKAGRVGVLDDFPGMTCGVWQMRPESLGFVRIAGSDVNVPPSVNPRYLDAEIDRLTLVAALKRARRIFDTAPIRDMVASNTLPGPDVRSDDEWLGFARNYGSSSYHLMGTCRMGPASDPTSVVGCDLRVRGIDGLYVCDSSVMPSMPSANTYASTLMIAEKGADLILGKAPLPAAVLEEHQLANELPGPRAASV
jgi:choline dehydrogenase